MSCLTKTNFEALPLKREKVDLADFGDDAYVWIQALTGEQLVDLRKQFGARGDTSDTEFTCQVLYFCLTDDDGKRIFQDAGDVKFLLKQSVGLLQSLAERALIISDVLTVKKKDSTLTTSSS